MAARLLSARACSIRAPSLRLSRFLLCLPAPRQFVHSHRSDGGRRRERKLVFLGERMQRAIEQRNPTLYHNSLCVRSPRLLIQHFQWSPMEQGKLTPLLFEADNDAFACTTFRNIHVLIECVNI